MSAYILCSGLLARHPLKIKETGLLIYSAEELSYYIYNSFYLIDESFISEEMFTFIEIELGLGESAQKLKKLWNENVSLGMMLTAILREYHYYTENELKTFVQKYDEYRHQPPAVRKVRKADFLLEKGHYLAAIQIYRQFNNVRRDPHMPEDFYMKIFQHMAVSLMHLGLMEEALEAFLAAYKEYKSPELLAQIYQFSCMTELKLPSELYREIKPQSESEWREGFNEVRDQGALLASTGSTAGMFTKDSVKRKEALSKHIEGIKKEYRAAIS